MGSAESIAGLSATAASILFAVTGLILAIPSTDSKDNPLASFARRTTLHLLIPSLFALFVTSFLYAVIGGETTCQRAFVLAVPAGGLLGIGVLGTFVAIVWSLKAYVRDSETIIRSGRWLCYAAWLMAFVQDGLMAVFAARELNSRVLGLSPDWKGMVILGAGASGLLALVAFAQRRLRPQGFSSSSRLITATASSTLAGVLVVVTFFNLVALRSADSWIVHPAPMLQLVLSVTLAFVLVAGLLLIATLSMLSSPDDLGPDPGRDLAG